MPIALIIGKTASSMGRKTNPEEYIIYAEIDIAKHKFDFCIIDSALNRIRTGIIINNDTGFKEFLRIIETYDNVYNPMLLNSIETKRMKKSGG